MKSIISSEFRDLKKQLLEKPVNSLKRKPEEEKAVSFEYNGNQELFDFNCSVRDKLGHLKCSLEESTIEDIESEIENIIRDIRTRNKLIKIADRTEGGWGTVEEYETCDYADDSDDDRKIRQANSRALQKIVVYSHVDLRRLLQTIIAGFIFFVANIKAGQQGHSISVSGAASGVILDQTVGHKSAVECHKIMQSNNSCSNIRSPLPGGQPGYLQRRQVPEKLETKVKYNFESSSVACYGDSVVKLNKGESTVPYKTVKGSLPRNIDFWRGIKGTPIWNMD